MSRSVVYLGPPSTFAEIAVNKLTEKWAEPGELRPGSSVVAALDEVRAGTARAAVVPIENSIEGPVSGTLDEIAAQPPLRIVDEVAIPVRFALMRPADRIDEPIRAVGSHPHGLAQCRRWLHEHLPEAELVLTASTAAAAEALVSGALVDYDAAIAAPLAAERYGLAVVADGVGDNPEAVTRFVQVEQPGRVPGPTGADKTSLMLFMKANRAGALLEILTELAVRGINMTRLESRPTRHALGDYCFSVDIEGHLAEARVGEALMGLRRACAEVLFLGSYPRHDQQQPSLPEGVADEDFAVAAEWLAALRSGTAG